MEVGPLATSLDRAGELAVDVEALDLAVPRRRDVLPLVGAQRGAGAECALGGELGARSAGAAGRVQRVAQTAGALTGDDRTSVAGDRGRLHPPLEREAARQVEGLAAGDGHDGVLAVERHRLSVLAHDARGLAERAVVVVAGAVLRHARRLVEVPRPDEPLGRGERGSRARQHEAGGEERATAQGARGSTSAVGAVHQYLRWNTRMDLPRDPAGGRRNDSMVCIGAGAPGLNALFDVQREIGSRPHVGHAQGLGQRMRNPHGGICRRATGHRQSAPPLRRLSFY